MGKRTWLTIVFLMLTGPVTALARNAEAPPVSHRVLLEQYTDDLRTNPSDAKLRERIIRLVAIMHPAPRVPEKVVELQGEAEAALSGSRSQKGFADAVSAFEKASLLAPWLGDVYYDLAKAQEAAGQYSDAVLSWRLYLFAEPRAPDRTKIELRMGADKELAKRASDQ